MHEVAGGGKSVLLHLNQLRKEIVQKNSAILSFRKRKISEQTYPLIFVGLRVRQMEATYHMTKY